MVAATLSDDIPLTEPVPDPTPGGFLESAFIVWFHPELQLVRKGALYGVGATPVYDAVIGSLDDVVFSGFVVQEGLAATPDALFPYDAENAGFLIRAPTPRPLPQLALSTTDAPLVGQETVITFQLDRSWDQPIEIAVDSSDPEVVFVPPSVHIGVGETSTQLSVTPTDTGEVTVTGTMPVNIGARSANVTLNVSEKNVPPANSGCTCDIHRSDSPSALSALLLLLGSLLLGMGFRRRTQSRAE